MKPRHTFDLLVIGVEWGYGRRQGWLSNIHLAARDPSHRGAGDARQDVQGNDRRAAPLADRALRGRSRPAVTAAPSTCADDGGGDRLRRAAVVDPLSRRGGAAFRPGAPLPPGQVRRPRPTPWTRSERLLGPPVAVADEDRLSSSSTPAGAAAGRRGRAAASSKAGCRNEAGDAIRWLTRERPAVARASPAAARRAIRYRQAARQTLLTDGRRVAVGKRRSLLVAMDQGGR